MIQVRFELIQFINATAHQYPLKIFHGDITDCFLNTYINKHECLHHSCSAETSRLDRILKFDTQILRLHLKAILSKFDLFVFNRHFRIISD